MKENQFKLTVKKVLKGLAFAVTILVFMPSFLVSCSGQTVEISAMNAMAGISISGTKVSDPHPVLIVCLLLPLAIIALLYIKKYAEKIKVLAISIISAVDFFVWIFFKYAVKKAVESYYCTLSVTTWYVMNMIFIVLIAGISFLVYVNKFEIDGEIVNDIKNFNKKKNINDIEKDQGPVDEKPDQQKIGTVNTESVQKIVKKIKGLPRAAVIGLIAAVIGVIALIVVASQPPKINLNNYLIYESTGYDGIGKSTVKIDWDTIKEKYGNKIKFNKSTNQLTILNYSDAMIALKNSVGVEQDVSDHLYNGDTVKYTFNINDDVVNQLNCKLEYTNGEYVVEGLQDTVKVDLFNGATEPYIVFSGRDGETKANLNLNLEDGTELYRDDNVVIVYRNNYGEYASVVQDNKEVCKLRYLISKSDDLSNGDTITLYFDGVEKLAELGYIPKVNNIQYTVSDRPELLTSHTQVFPESVLDAANRVLAKYSGGYTKYENASINNIYFAKAKDSTVTDNKSLIIVDMEYDEVFTMVSTTTYHRNGYILLENVYIDNDRICYDNSRFSSYSSWSFEIKNIDEVIENYSNNYEITKVE